MKSTIIRMIKPSFQVETPIPDISPRSANEVHRWLNQTADNLDDARFKEGFSGNGLIVASQAIILRLMAASLVENPCQNYSGKDEGNTP